MFKGGGGGGGGQRHLDFVSVADVDDQERVGNSLVWFGDSEAELVEILNIVFGHDIKAEVWSRF